MWPTFLKIAFRILVRNRRFSIINLAGLTLGLTSFIVIFGWLHDEFTFDQFHGNRERLYQLVIKHPQGIMDPNTPFALAPRLAGTYPEIQSHTTVMRMESRRQYSFAFLHDSLDRVNAYEPAVARVDTSFFRMFDFPSLYGNRNAFLKNPDDVVISSRIASLYFPEIDPVGQSILMNNTQMLTIRGVVEIPANSFFQFDFFVPVFNDLSEDWNWSDPSYLLLDERTDPTRFESKISGFFNEQYPHALSGEYQLKLIPIHKAHLAIGGKGKVWMFSIVAILLLAVASLNYMNLTTANYSKRMREAGIRRVMGGKRRHLMIHFFFESILLALTAMIIGLFLAELAMPFMSQIFGRNVEIGYINNPLILLILLLIVFMLGSLAAIYPSTLFSRGNPSEILHSNFMQVGRRSSFLVIAIVFQFTLSIALMISSLIVIKQVRYAAHANLGFSVENVMSIPMNRGLGQNFFSFLNRLEEHPEIADVTAGQSFPYNEDYKTNIDWATKSDPAGGLCRYSICLNNFPELFQMELVSGRFFSEQYLADTDKFIINETAADMLELKDPLGEMVNMWGLNGQIIGVVKDFHHVSLHREILPHIFNIHPSVYRNMRYIFVKLRKSYTPEVLEYIESLCREMSPDYPFSYTFLEEEKRSLYESDGMLSMILGMFALLALLVSSLGIYGLAFFSAEKQSKDITIRKVFGADFWRIFIIFSRQMALRIGISVILATGASLLIMSRWLRNFAYHIQPDPFVILIPLVLALLIAGTATLLAIWRLLMENPARFLKQE